MIKEALLQNTTQADHAFHFLRSEVLSCRLAPGAKIRINDIAVQLDVSLGSVREALSRLSADGMVVAQAQKGYTVAPVSKADLADLTGTRVSVEQLCLRKAMEHNDVEWESGIVAACHRLSRIPETDPADKHLLNEAWSTAHAAFHLALVAGCGSPSLLRIRDNLYTQTERYRRLSVPLRRQKRDVNAEHKAIVDAVLARRVDKACELISGHFWKTTQILLASPVLNVSDD